MLMIIFEQLGETFLREGLVYRSSIDWNYLSHYDSFEFTKYFNAS